MGQSDAMVIAPDMVDEVCGQNHAGGGQGPQR